MSESADLLVNTPDLWFFVGTDSEEKSWNPGILRRILTMRFLYVRLYELWFHVNEVTYDNLSAVHWTAYASIAVQPHIFVE
jgi:hypothetical protein